MTAEPLDLRVDDDGFVCPVALESRSSGTGVGREASAIVRVGPAGL